MGEATAVVEAAKKDWQRKGPHHGKAQRTDAAAYSKFIGHPGQAAAEAVRLFHQFTAPGDAEAQCALFQREGLVDIVLSEDVDVLMVGCPWSMTNWSSKDARGDGTRWRTLRPGEGASLSGKRPPPATRANRG